MIERVSVETTETNGKKEKRKKNRLPRREAKVKAREKRIRRAFRITRLRAFKNFLYWFFGVLSSVGILLGGIFIGAGVIPVSTLVGKDTVSEYVGPNVYDKSIVSILMNIDSFTFEDFPALEKSLGEALGEGNEISAFTKHQKVKELPALNAEFKMTENSESAKNYYYIKATPQNSTMSTGGQSAEPEYENAFDKDGKLLPELRDAYTSGTLELYIAPLFDLPLVEGLSAINQYLDYVAVTDVLKLAGMEEGALVYDIMKGVYIGDFMKSTDDGGFSAETILNNATLETLGGADMLGDLGNFSFFKGYEKVASEDYPSVKLDGGKYYIKKDDDGDDAKFTSEPKQYYIELVAHVPANGDNPEIKGEYARAFTDEGEFITSYTKEDGTPVTYSNFDAVETAKVLCYANLAEIAFTDTLSLIGDSILRQDIVGLMESFGMDVGEDSLIKKVFEGYTIESFGKDPDEPGAFVFENIELSALLGEYEDEGEDANNGIYDLLLAITGDKPSRSDYDTDQAYKDAVALAANGLTVSSLTDGFEIENVKLSAILGDYTDEGEDANNELYDILLAVTGNKPVKGADETQEQYDARVAEAANDLTVDALTGNFDFEGIELSMILGEYSATGENANNELYDMLLAITGTKPVKEADETQEQYDARVAQAANALTVGSLTDGFNLDNVKISDIIDGLDEDTLNLLCDGINPAKKTAWEAEHPDEPYVPIDKDTITVADFEYFKVDNIKLSSVLGDYDEKDASDNYTNKELYDILLSAKDMMPTQEADESDEDFILRTKVIVEGLTVSSLQGLQTGNISLNTVLPVADNGDLYDILVSALVLSDANEDGVIDGYDIIVDDLGSFNAGRIPLNTVLPAVDNADLYDILKPALNKANAEDILVDDLSDFTAGNIPLSTVLPVADNGDLYDILVSALVLSDANEDGVTDGYDIIVDDLGSFNAGNIPLSTVLPVADNGDLYDILKPALNKTNAEDILVDDLSDFKAGNIPLSTVLPVADNGDLYDILKPALNKADAEDILVDDLSDFTAGNIPLSTVLPVADNRNLYDILMSALTIPDTNDDRVVNEEDIVVDSLSSFKAENIVLDVVLPIEDNSNLYSILLSALSNTDGTPKFTDASQITVGSLSDFKANNIKLTAVLEEASNESLYNILLPALDKTNASDIKVGDLSSFNASNIELSSIFTTEQSNPILKALLADGDTKVGEIGTKINALTLFDIFGEDCFTTTWSGEYTGDKFRLDDSNPNKIKYIRDNVNGTYYLKGGLWLLFAFEAKDVSDENGAPAYYEQSTTTMESLQGGGTDMSDMIMNATLETLVEAGVLSGHFNPKIERLTINEVINTLNTWADTIPGL